MDQQQKFENLLKNKKNKELLNKLGGSNKELFTQYLEFASLLSKDCDKLQRSDFMPPSEDEIESIDVIKKRERNRDILIHMNSLKIKIASDLDNTDILEGRTSIISPKSKCVDNINIACGNATADGEAEEYLNKLKNSFGRSRRKRSRGKRSRRKRSRRKRSRRKRSRRKRSRRKR